MNQSGASNVSWATLVRVVLALCALLVTACAPKAPRPPPRPAYLNHEIIYRGETLSVIAAWYTGASQNWREIAAANPEVNPHRLKPGMEIRIPRALVVREDSLPKSFVEAAAARVRSAAPEKGAEESTAQDTLPVPQPPRVTPPGAEDVLKSAGTSETPSGPPPQLPDPTKAREGGTLTTDSKTQAAGASSAPADHDRQKTRDQLLKELLQEY